MSIYRITSTYIGNKLPHCPCHRNSAVLSETACKCLKAWSKLFFIFLHEPLTDVTSFVQICCSAGRGRAVCHSFLTVRVLMKCAFANHSYDSLSHRAAMLHKQSIEIYLLKECQTPHTFKTNMKARTIFSMTLHFL